MPTKSRQVWLRGSILRGTAHFDCFADILSVLDASFREDERDRRSGSLGVAVGERTGLENRIGRASSLPRGVTSVREPKRAREFV